MARVPSPAFDTHACLKCPSDIQGTTLNCRNSLTLCSDPRMNTRLNQHLGHSLQMNSFCITPCRLLYHWNLSLRPGTASNKRFFRDLSKSRVSRCLLNPTSVESFRCLACNSINLSDLIIAENLWQLAMVSMSSWPLLNKYQSSNYVLVLKGSLLPPRRVLWWPSLLGKWRLLLYQHASMCDLPSHLYVLGLFFIFQIFYTDHMSLPSKKSSE